MKRLTGMSIYLLVLAATFPSTDSRAQTSSAPGPSAADNITNQIMEKRHRLDQYLKLMKDPNPATRLTAIQQALKDSDPVVRGAAMSAYLTRFNALTPEVNLEKGDVISPQDVPRLTLQDIRWADDGASAIGVYSGPCTSRAARLQIAGGKLAIAYDGVCLRPVLLGINVGGDEVRAKKEVLIPCQAILVPNNEDTSLEGSLRCVGMATPLPVQLPFGP